MAMSGEHIWKPNRPWAKFVGKSTDSSAASAIFLIPSASVCVRQLPPSSDGVRFGPHLVRVGDGNMSGGHVDDVGRAYLGTQHAMGQICGENRPTLVLFLPFPDSISFHLLPSDSAIFRQHPFRIASGPRV